MFETCEIVAWLLEERSDSLLNIRRAFAAWNVEDNISSKVL